MAINDGLANAPANTPQLPNLLSGYSVRPTWNVAGVDYAVGYASGTILKAPSTISMAGVSVDSANHIINVSGSNVTLSGYDFSLNGGWQVSVNGGTNVAIENSKFVVGSNGNTPIYVSPNASNVTIQNNLIDGAGTSAQMLIAADGAGTTTIQYNMIQNAWGQNLVMSSDVGGENWIVQYNVIKNAGLGYSAGAHGDWIQTYNLPGHNTNSFEVNYNTFIQDTPIAEGRTQGISAFSANSGSTAGGVQTETFNNNTFIANNGSYVNYGIILDTSRLIGTATIQNNYFDTTNIGSANGGGGSWEYVGNYNGSSGGPYHGTVTQSNNANMVTGTYLGGQSGTPSSGTTAPSTPPPSTTAPGAPTIASFSADSGTVGDKITNDNTIELKGSAAAGSTVKFYDGTTQIGSTTADSSGNWDYITKVLTDAKHTLTATATNASGQTSAASSALAVTVDTQAPAAPTIASHTVNSANQVVLSGTAEASSVVKVFDGPTQIGTTTANSSGAWGYTSAGLAAGSHSLTAKATDAAGNTGAASTAFAASISNSTAPATPTSPTPTPDKVIESAGATSLVESAGKFYLNSSTGSGPSLKYHGVDFVDGSDFTWAPIGAEKTATGYEVVWKEAGTGQYTAWNTDSNGNYVSHVSSLTGSTSGGSVSGTNSGLQSLETTFHQDLNGDGQIGATSSTTPTTPTSPTPTAGTVIESAGATRLVESNDKYYLNSGTGTGPSLKYHGVDFVDGSDFTWAPIGAEKTTTGYQVVWKEASTGQYTAWNTDSNGNYVSHVSSLTGSTSGGSVSGTNSGLKSLETSFHQDLNGDGQIGASSVTTSSTSTSQVVATSSSTGTNTQTSTSGNDVFVGTSKADTFSFAANFGNDVIKGFVASGPAHDTVEFSKSVFDSFASVLSHAAQSGTDVVIATGSDTLTLKNTQLDKLNSHDFHFA